MWWWKKKKYDYPDAGINASECIKQKIEEFRALPEHLKEEEPLLYYLLGSGTPPYKMSKEDSLYADVSNVEGQYCINCIYSYYQPLRKVLICSQIRGAILKEGWCKLWNKKT